MQSVIGCKDFAMADFTHYNNSDLRRDLCAGKGRTAVEKGGLRPASDICSIFHFYWKYGTNSGS